MSKVVLETETGEIVTNLNDGDRILRANSIEAFKELETPPKGESFSKLYHKVLPKLAQCKLSSAEWAVFLYLGTNLRYISNVAQYRNGRLITRENLSADLKLPEITVKRAVLRLIKEGLIIEARTIEGKVFVINPFVVSVGGKISKTVYDLFRKSKWARW
ncbi:MAG TPA: hypothetical protein DCE11_04090 [Ruminiclostridium sp.]|nr:hypothetical protein [Ruminiclostridium sp.]